MFLPSLPHLLPSRRIFNPFPLFRPWHVWILRTVTRAVAAPLRKRLPGNRPGRVSLCRGSASLRSRRRSLSRLSRSKHRGSKWKNSFLPEPFNPPFFFACLRGQPAWFHKYISSRRLFTGSSRPFPPTLLASPLEPDLQRVIASAECACSPSRL